MNSEHKKIKKLVTELYDIIKEATIKLEDIRKNCDHPEFTVEMFSWRVGSYYPSRICSICESSITGITKEEEQDCWDKHTKESKMYISSSYGK